MAAPLRGHTCSSSSLREFLFLFLVNAKASARMKTTTHRVALNIEYGKKRMRENGEKMEEKKEEIDKEICGR
jgi:hypothetical protein